MDTIVQEGRLVAPLEIGAVSLLVRDLEAVAGFYRGVLGLAVVDATDDAVVLGAGGVGFLTLQQRPGLALRDPAEAGLYHVAYVLPARADLGRWLRHAGRRGVTLDGAADHLVSEAVYLHDPEGNGVEIYVDRPRAEWRWQDGSVAMANDRLDLQGLQALARDEWGGAPDGTRIGHVHLQVGSIAEAEAFYAGALGLAVTRRWPQALFMSTGGYHHHLAANTWHSLGAGRRDPDRAGLHSVTLQAAPTAGRPGAELRDPWGTLFHIIASEGTDQ